HAPSLIAPMLIVGAVIVHASAAVPKVQATTPPDVMKLAGELSVDDVFRQLDAARSLAALGPAAAPATEALIGVLKRNDGMVELTLPNSGDRVFTFNPVQTLAVDALAGIGTAAIEPIHGAIRSADPAALEVSYLADALARMQQAAATAIVFDLLGNDRPA